MSEKLLKKFIENNVEEKDMELALKSYKLLDKQGPMSKADFIHQMGFTDGQKLHIITKLSTLIPIYEDDELIGVI